MVRVARKNPRVELKDLKFIERYCTDCTALSASVGSTRTVTRGFKESLNTSVNGVSATFPLVGNLEVEDGRFFTDDEERRSSFVCVIGQDLVEKLFEGVDPMGKKIKFGGNRFRVIGLLKAKGSAFGQSLDNLIYFPVSTFGKVFGTRRSVEIHGKANDRESFESAVDQVRLAMRIRHKLKPKEEDDFGILSTRDINGFVDQVALLVQTFVFPITLVAMIVAAIVIMNIMLVSVTERTFEIGLRKSIGARRRDILLQFLVEAVIISALGGVIGLLFAAFTTQAVEAATSLPTRISLVYIAIAIGGSALVGLLSGVFPAYRASRLDPIVAINAER